MIIIITIIIVTIFIIILILLLYVDMNNIPIIQVAGGIPGINEGED